MNIDLEAHPLWDVVCAARDDIDNKPKDAHPGLAAELDQIEAQLFRLEFLLTEYPAYVGNKS